MTVGKSVSRLDMWSSGASTDVRSIHPVHPHVVSLIEDIRDEIPHLALRKPSAFQLLGPIWERVLRVDDPFHNTNHLFSCCIRHADPVTSGFVGVFLESSIGIGL